MQTIAWIGAAEAQELTDGIGVGGSSVVRCHTAGEVEIALASGLADCLVVDLDLASSWLSPSSAQQFLSDLPVVLRLELNPRSARTMSRLIPFISRRCIATVRGADGLAKDVSSLLSERVSPTAEFDLVSRILPTVESAARLILVGAAALGKRRTTVTGLSSACHIPCRTLVWRVRRHCSGSPHELIGASVAVHATYRREILGWTQKRCASVAKFTDASALTRYIGRHSDKRLRGDRTASTLDDSLIRWARLAAPR